MKFIDLHCDTAMRMYEEKGKLKKNDFSIDIEKLKKGECMALKWTLCQGQLKKEG